MNIKEDYEQQIQFDDQTVNEEGGYKKHQAVRGVLSSISEINEVDSQSNNRGALQGSISGSGLNQSYIL